MSNGRQKDKWFVLYLASIAGTAVLLTIAMALFKNGAAGLIIGILSMPLLLIVCLCLVAVLCGGEQSYSLHSEKIGYLRVISGEMEGAAIPLKDGESIILGRDPTQVELIFHCQRVSRCHCKITFYAQIDSFGITNYSTNGVVIGAKRFTERQIEIFAESNTRISISDSDSMLLV